MEVYLDNSSTTKCFESVVALVAKVMSNDYGNSSSLHAKGVQAEQYIRESKSIIAKNLKVKEKEIIFTSGGTEANNLAIIGTAMANARSGNHIISTMIEHPAILKAMEYLANQGFQVTYLPVDSNGKVRLRSLENAITKNTILVSIMHTNNEIGALQPLLEAGEIIKRKNAKTIFHVDAVQGYGKFRILPHKLNIDMLSVSGHKIHGPKGVGFLYCSEKIKILPVTFGGGQQNGLRSGTENVPGIAGMGKAIEEIYEEFDDKIKKIYLLKTKFIQGISVIEGAFVNGLTGTDSAPHIVSVSVSGIRSEVLVHALEAKGIFVSAGSACSAKKNASSSTLKAIGVKQELLNSTIRFSFSFYTSEDEIDYTLSEMYDMIPLLRRYSRQ